ncbi:hypothetical protein [Limnobaculum parvum]|uniref:hypothetical protein n=1 Tax=Limnobaculum parvum TaxID=2172103 RepID=UPI0013006B43|nr:hypothetical protein [Limnobaculum parvum]
MKHLMVFHPAGQRCSTGLFLFVVGLRQVDPNTRPSQRLAILKYKTELSEI